MDKKKRIIFVGIDGASYSLIRELAQTGVMPHLNRVQDQGVLSRMLAPLPDNSAVSWSSIMTGKNPGEHGIFGFTDLIPHTYTLRFPNFLSLQASTFWQKDREKRHVIINLPFTYPVQEMNGCMVSGFVSPTLEKAAYPEDFLLYLKSIDYQIDPDTNKINQSKELFLKSLFEVLGKREQVYRTLWERENWDVFMIVFTGTDRLGHYFQDDWEEKKAPFYESFLEYYTRIDEQIGWIVDHKKENDVLMMMSDHGMESIQSEVYLNTFLEREGFLQITKSEIINYNNLTSQTKAFVLEPSRIYLNYSSRYPQGSVKPDDREAIIKDLISLFSVFCYQDKAEKIVDRVVRKEEIYTGDQMDNAPDLILVPGKGFSLRGTLGNDQVFGLSSTIKGMHRGDDAFLYIYGTNAGSLLPEVPRTEDVLSIATKLKES